MSLFTEKGSRGIGRAADGLDTEAERKTTCTSAEMPLDRTLEAAHKPTSRLHTMMLKPWLLLHDVAHFVQRSQ